MFMLNQKGQAFSVFNLLIAAVVAVVLLALLLSILAQIVPPGSSQDPPIAAASIVKDAVSNKASLQQTSEVIFVTNTSLNRRALALETEGKINDNEVCVGISTDDFQDSDNEDVWFVNDSTSITYKGSDRRRAHIMVICDSISRIDEGTDSYFEDFTADEFQEDYFDNCQCFDEDNIETCCFVLIKR